MFQTWLLLSIAALLIWGGWGVFANLTAKYLGGFSALVWEVAGAMILGGAVLLWLAWNGTLETTGKGIGFGIATGLTYTAGLAFLFLALNQAGNPQGAPGTGGSVHTILIITALYPIVATALNYLILSEPLSTRQIVGMGVGLAGIAILVSE